MRRLTFAVLYVAIGLSFGCGEAFDTTPRFLQFIQSDDISRIVFEVDYVFDHGPHWKVGKDMEDDLHKIVDKPSGISVKRDDIIAPRGADHKWTGYEVGELIDKTYDLRVPDRTAKVHVLFVDGGFQADSNGSRVLGLAWNYQNIVLFKDNIMAGCQLNDEKHDAKLMKRFCEKAEKSVWIHEFGHVIGLVDAGLKMTTDHLDEEHGKHCSNKNCVMYWQHRSSFIFKKLTGRYMEGKEMELGFGQDCLNDIAQVR